MPTWLRLFSDGYTDSEGAPALDPDDESLIVSILSAGTFLGALSAAPTADFFGRRMGLMLSTAIVFNLGVILQTAATSQGLFIAGRFFAGYGVGLISAMIPLYQSETAPKWIRGTIVGTYQLAITVGLFLASIVNNGTKDMETTACYRIPVALQFAWALILVGGLLFLPETPRFNIKKGRFEKAAQALSRLRRLPIDHPSLVEELAEIRANHEYEMSLGKGTYGDCFKGTVGKRLMTGCLLQALQQLSGVNFIFYYGTAYFTRAGFRNPFIIQVITNTVNVVRTGPLQALLCKPELTLSRPAHSPVSISSRSLDVAIFSSWVQLACASVNSSSLSLAPLPAPRILPLNELPSRSFAFTSSSSPVPGAQLHGWSRVKCSH